MAAAKGSGPNGEWTEKDEVWHQTVLEKKDPADRALIVGNPDCPEWLIRGTLIRDTYEECLMAAALNPNAPEDAIPIAYDRLPYLSTPEFKKKRINKILEYKNPNHTNVIASQIANDRDQFIKRHIQEQEYKLKNKPISNPKREWDETLKYKVAMVICPAWGNFFPPYGTAKLTALMRQYGYSVKVYDNNIESFHFLNKNHGVNYWETNIHWIWEDLEYFNKVLLPDLEPLMNEIIADIFKNNVKVVGFSLYHTNQVVTAIFAKKIREIDPNICILAGGPGATMTGEWWFKTHGEVFNYIFKGEAEDTLINLLENLPTKNLPYNKVVGSVDSKLELEQYPFPDYSDYNLKLYAINGVSIETSRGCVAKCGFCAETHFWKYRDKDAERIVEEFEHQINKYGTKRFWIVDSLINGNLKIFSKWMDLVIEKNLELQWNCYSRCDGRMNADFFKKIKKSGCTMLSFGIESGSQKVLDDMHKKVKVWEILQNMKDCHEAGIFIHSSWLQGYATETPLDHMHSRQLMYNVRKWLGAASLGMGAGITPNSDTDTNWMAYKIQWKKTHADGTIWRGHASDKFLGDWYTEGYKCTVLSRFIRVKLMNVWCHSLKLNCSETIVDFGNFYPDINKFYSLKFVKRRNVDFLEQNNYINVKQGVGDDISGLLIQDYLSFIYSLYEVYGELEWTFHCDPDMDKSNFGEFITRKYWCDAKAHINNDGNYTLSVSHRLLHSGLNEDKNVVQLTGEVDYDAERLREDKSFDIYIELQGNFKNWISSEIQVEESVHPQYRKKSWLLMESK